MNSEQDPSFAAGNRVRVARVNPPGHRRTPFYIRGKTGVIERDCGRHLNPEDLAYGWTGRPLRRLYRVRFMQNEVWSDYEGSPTDTIDVDIYEHWLAPITTAHL
jgi:nitrile hydratase subunit beta